MLLTSGSRFIRSLANQNVTRPFSCIDFRCASNLPQSKALERKMTVFLSLLALFTSPK